jgi:cytochrome c553
MTTAMVHGEIPDPAKIRFFEERIRPVLVEKCESCHSAGAEKLKANLLLDTAEGLRHGGDSGPAIITGDPGSSLLIQAIRWNDPDFRMPPKEQLPAQVVKDFEQWIRDGAVDPRKGVPVLAKVDAAEVKAHWSFQPVKEPRASAVVNTAWPNGDIDRFVLAKLEQAGLKPVADASPESLLRRVVFDLTGLPPTPAQINSFTRACAAEGGEISQKAYSSVVDELLSSPAFGERWGRHWLDVARFAESTGKERNHTFPEAWRYRDWVIDAFNADKPYDRFIREQIAGDLLADDATPAERDALTVATGFLAIGTKSLNERRKEQFIADLVDEQIDTTTRAVLGVTVACARCHDHKFDPFTQRDYYALAGIFRSTETCYGTTDEAVQNRQPSKLIALEYSPRAELAVARPALSRRLRPDARPKGDPAKAAAKGPVQRKADAALAALGLADNRATNAMAMGVQEATPGDAYLLVRGEISQRKGKVPRGFVEALSRENPPKIPTTESGRRELAEWLTGESNPLTARVAVNRIWLHLFGQGLVRTADDFGLNGEKPTHPELLDYLAARFMAGNWSTKALIRSIVTSHTYQLSTATDQRAYVIDPDDTLLWRARPRRLDAEAIRDAMLAASGELDARPLHGSLVAQVGDTFIGGRYRGDRFNVAFDKRSVYLPVVRDAVVDSLEVFDFAEPSLVVAARDDTNVPAQALYLMNSPFVMEQSRALARRLIGSKMADDRSRIIFAYRLVLGRSPTATEVERSLAFLNRETASTDTRSGEAAGRETAWALFAQGLFATAEFRYLR